MHALVELLAEARSGLAWLRPEAAFAVLTDGAALVDIRPLEQRIAEGEVPGAIIIGRNVLEWRLDPRSEARIPALARADAQIIVMCSEGYASTLAWLLCFYILVLTLAIFRSGDFWVHYEGQARKGE